MPRMLARSLLLAVAVLTAGAPAATAAVADRVIPLYEADDGVQVGVGKRNVYLRFAPKAAKLYRSLAGRTVTVGCGRQGEESGSSVIVGGSIDTDTGRIKSIGPGYSSTDQRFPRTRGRVDLPFVADPYDVCYLATKERATDRVCLPLSTGSEQGQCVRMIVALTDTGRALIDARSRLIELDAVSDEARGAPTTLARLQQTFGPDVTALDGPDASPAPGKVGFWQEGQTTVVAVVLRDGHRQFVREDGEVYSTNVAELSGGSDDVFAFPYSKFT
jgi:hypothetical protein